MKIIEANVALVSREKGDRIPYRALVKIGDGDVTEYCGQADRLDPKEALMAALSTACGVMETELRRSLSVKIQVTW